MKRALILMRAALSAFRQPVFTLAGVQLLCRWILQEGTVGSQGDSLVDNLILKITVNAPGVQ
jgi:hypothetical protein